MKVGMVAIVITIHELAGHRRHTMVIGWATPTYLTILPEPGRPGAKGGKRIALNMVSI